MGAVAAPAEALAWHHGAELLARLTAAGYSISRRSVELDLRELSLVFPLLCNDGGTPFGWFWQPGVSVELQGITLI